MLASEACAPRSDSEIELILLFRWRHGVMRSLPLFLLALVSRPLLKNIVRLSSGHPKDGTEALIFQGPPPRTVPGSSTETGPQVPLLAADWGFQTCPKPAGSCGTCPNSLPDSWGEASGSILLFLYSFEMEPISPKPKTEAQDPSDMENAPAR